MKSISELIKTISSATSKIIWTLGLNAFLLILFLIFIDFILGGIIFYKYVFLVETAGPTAPKNILRFDDKAYQNVLIELRAKESVK